MKQTAFFLNGIMSGIFLCVGCAVSMSAGPKALGAFLFSLGLAAIINFGFGLYTGKAGYMAVMPPAYIAETLLTLLGNISGTAAGGILLNLTRFGAELSGKAAAVTEAKFTDSPASIFILSVFCGILMFTAVEGNKRASSKNDFIGALFITVMPVMVFIMCGFNHCVADSAYFFISGCAHAEYAALYFLLSVTGNAAGCMAIPLMMRLMRRPAAEAM